MTLKHFLKSLYSSSNNKFDFNFVIEDSDKLLKGISIKCNILESEDPDHLLINAEYKLIDDEFMALIEKDDSCTIVAASQRIIDLIGIKMKSIKTINKYRFDELLLNQKDSDVYKLNHVLFRQNVSWKNTEVQSTFAQSEINLKIVTIFKNKSERCIIFKLQESSLDLDISPKKNSSLVSESVIDGADSIISSEDYSNKNRSLESESVIDTTASMISSEYYSKKNADGKYTLSQSKFNNFKKFVKSSMLMSILMLVSSVLSLVLLIHQDSVARNLFQLKIIFKDFQRHLIKFVKYFKLFI